nr:hypothetical protein [Tanacetum cinerariifolium]
MDSIFPLGQKNTLAEYMILSGADNRPPMLEKDLYDSWKIQMELYMQNIEHGRMILESVEIGPLIWPTLEENGERIMRIKQFQVNTKFLNSLPPEWSKFVTDVKLVKGLHTTIFDQLPAYLEQHELHANEPKQPRNAVWYKEKAMLAEAQEAGQILKEEQLAFLADLGVPDGQAFQTIILNNAIFQTEDLDTYDSSNVQAILMANISNYGSDVISEVPHSKPYLNDMENQSVLAMQDLNNHQL